jgi:hypothetical protein
MMNGLKLVAVFVLCGSGTIHAQYVPVVAKIKQVREITRPGQPSETHTREGNFYRRSDGSTLEEWTVVDGDTSRGVGELTDNQANITYQLNLVGRTAIQRRETLPSGVTSLAGPPQLPEKQGLSSPIIVGGIACVVLPVKSSPSLALNVTGQVCVSRQHNLTVRRDITSTAQGGRTDHTTYEMSDVRLYMEPDSKLFDLRARGFTVLTAQEPAPKVP